MTVAIFYFSPTGSTAQIAKVVLKTLLDLKIEVEEHDITSFSNRQESIDFQNYELIFFGFPVYVHRAPSLIREWILTLDGKGRRCSTFFTYGGISMGMAHYDTHERLKRQNFQPFSSAEFVAKHTYNLGGWELLENRPNENDFSIARQYTMKTYQAVKNSFYSNLSFKEPHTTEKKLKRLNRGRSGVKPPSREGQSCSMCLECEKECPSNAMNAQIGEADKKICIKCLRCVYICPDGVLKTNDLTPFYKLIVEKGPQSLSKIENKQSKFYV